MSPLTPSVCHNACNIPGNNLELECNPLDAVFFVFSSPPQAIWGRPKYRDNVPRPRGIHDYYNVMWDPHVKRGDPLRKAIQKEKIKKCLQPEKKSKKRIKDGRSFTPPPLDGREHCQLQTEHIWEPLDVDVISCDVRTQTLPTQELPINPWFTPSKLGQDKGTEILPGELFDFDCEIQPVVEALVGKVIEQGLLECMEEEELLTLRDQQMIFEERRRQEQLRLERLREREERLLEEKERLMREMERRRGYEQDAEYRVGAAAFSAIYLTDMRKGALKGLRSDGYLNSMRIISTIFIPWLNCQTEEVLSRESLARAILDDIIRFTTIKRETEYDGVKWVPPPSTPVGEMAGESTDVIDA